MPNFDRPQLHFTPRRGWINDPNGLVFDGGRYHLFAQHNPDDIVWGPMHWLHATSTDLVDWREEGIALYPDALGTMFSGSAAMLPGGRMALMYTAHGACEQQCVAFSKDGSHFEKFAGNPVIPNPGIPDFRDPKLFWNARYACWSAAVAAGDRVAFYRSDDLIRWRKTGEFGPDSNRFGDLFECPDVFPLTAPDGSEIWVLTASMIFKGGEKGGRMQYFLGTFDGEAFVQTAPSHCPLRLDEGYDCYAGVTYSGTQERLFMAWMTSGSCPLPTPGYCGGMTLARRLHLVMTPQGIRLAHKCVLPPIGAQANVASLPKKAFVIRAQARGAFELTLWGVAAGESLRVGLDARNCLYTVRSNSASFAADSAYNDDARRITRTRRLLEGPLEMQIVCDAWCVEIFADGGLYAHGLLAFAQGGFQRLTCEGEALSAVYSFE